MDIKTYSDALYGQFARIGKATSSPRRLMLLEVLCQGPRTVETLAKETGQSVANTSQHLQVLRGARLVEAERDGLHVVYSTAGDDVCSFLGMLRGLADARLAEVEQVRREYMEGRNMMERVDESVLIERVRNGEVTVLDVRPREEFEAGHVLGALSIPLRELEERLGSLERGRDVVAYCRGPYCVLAVEAIETLRAHGFTAFPLEDGVDELRAKGFALETGGGEHSLEQDDSSPSSETTTTK
ncbi:MAG: metalloregulator ArsR/SmtB family transcription factor [Gemmatimonadetes bacterium]|nr:metalloregulator ArsR/SmtB family transcription factor [Gemmatimonadota bacterium]